MDGSDDYFPFDDIVIDEQTLAVLESEEQKYLSQVPPPAKRQKTDNGWKPAPASNRAPVFDDNDLPEISVHGDGSYAVRGVPKAGGSNTATSVPRHAETVEPPRVQSRVANVTASRPNPRPEPPPRRDSFPLVAPTRAQPPPRPVAPATPHQPPRPVASDIQTEGLRKQIEELRKENQKYRAELKEATGARLAKQGEVSILRQKEEKVSAISLKQEESGDLKQQYKVAQDHATQVAQLKHAKEESEAKYMALQKETKAEIERIKTQFIFKQHEIESSARKPPMSVRAKRIAKEIPGTPLAVPSQIQSWNRNTTHNESPVRARDARRTPEKSKKLPRLLGFENSFADATPIRPRNGQSRPKQESETPARRREMSRAPSPIPFQQPFADNDIKMADSQDFGEVTSSGTAGVERTVDEAMPDDLQEIEPFNWKAELTRIILTHTSPQNISPTLKILVGAVLPPGSAERYSSAVTGILELVASTSQHKDYEAALKGVCQYFTSLITILSGNHLENELAALLNLLFCLSCSLPMFGSTLLAPSRENGDDYDILEILCSVIRDHLAPTKHPQSGSPLGGETVGLLEALCWNVKDELIGRLAMICKNKNLIMILLDTLQPAWLIGRGVRLLVFLATHPKLCRDLLSNSERPQLSDEVKAKDITRLPHIERLCSYLIEDSRKDSEGVEMKTQILTFFATLSVAHADLHATLVGCQAVIPSLVAFVTQMTTLLWEGDEFFVTSPETIARTIRTLNQTLFLMHHLVFGMEPNFNLRHRLHYAPSRTFNGITHMFIVTFGRLSCADPPEWIDTAQTLELETMAEMAQDLLDLVVDGPEADSIWTAYQVDPGDPGNDSDTDEEDMEAKLLGTNN
ncbi:hypothetical protein MSAN_00038400 [Mycena sanguinolenta]|uniref:DNA repair protein Rad26 n=1 Tax=Mycena sanguinolenta TaxID=230812 RepID=A0A8H6ZEJ3_9AGAR|nr:hypothetical protein MSAN_00038400 [Mycena sanguinolenta]